MPIVKIRIDEKGKVFKDFIGFKGMNCNKTDKYIDSLVPNLKLREKAVKLKKSTQHETEKEKRVA